MTTAFSRPDLHPDVQDLLNRTDVTVAELARLPEDLRYELINGRLVLSPAAPTVHSIICRAIANAIDVGCPFDYAVGEERAVMVDEHTERRPDILVIEASASLDSLIHHTDVLLAVEVVSPSSISRDWKIKRKQYAVSGIPSYWIVDLYTEQISFTQFLLGDNNVYHRHTETTDVVTVDVPWEVTIDLPALTRRRNEYIARASRR
ncbi:Uma2 family endonuclease [Actinoplanes sp. NPDC051470]|uniref:Uma2 family endonuclease n=1 Tax=Actinoplanes sp. NPDC051470 TaxID=3157224 RepID=UPI003437BD8E